MIMFCDKSDNSYGKINKKPFALYLKEQTVAFYSKPKSQLTETPKTSDKAISSVSQTERT